MNSIWLRKIQKWMLTPELFFAGVIGPGLLGLIDARFSGALVFDGQFAHATAMLLWLAGCYHGYRFGRYRSVWSLTGIEEWKTSFLRVTGMLFIGGIVLFGTFTFVFFDGPISVPLMYSLGLIGASFLYSAWYSYARARARKRAAISKSNRNS